MASPNSTVPTNTATVTKIARSTFVDPADPQAALDLAWVAVDRAALGEGDRALLAAENPFDHATADLAASGDL